MIISVKVRGYQGQGKLSKLIMRFTFGNISHVSFVFVYLNQRMQEIEAFQGKGVIKDDAKTNCPYIEYTVPLTGEQKQQVYEIVCSKLGAKYDWAGIWGFLRKKKHQNPAKWFCSELVAYALYKVGYPLSRREPWKETPTSVCESLRIHEVNNA